MPWLSIYDLKLVLLISKNKFIGPDKQIFLHVKIVIIILLINLNICFGCLKECPIEMVLLSTHNICFG